MKLSRQNILQSLQFVICCTPLVVCLPACSSDDDSPLSGIEEDADGRALRQLTISDASLTRATIDGETLSAAWTEGDKATYVNLSNLSGDMYFGNLTAASSTQTSLLEGSVNCRKGDHLAVIYPSVTSVSVISDSKASYTVDLREQTGTLADVGLRYHYVFGVADVTKVEGKKATGTASPMTSLLALCKFKFTDGTNPIAVKELKIRNGITGGVDYPMTGTVKFDVKSTKDNVTVETANSVKGTLTITLNSANTDGVYVAMFPVAQSSDFHFTVHDGSGNIYTGTAKAKLNAGKYYDSSLKLTKNN